MGKIFAKIVAMTPMESRQKKDGSGTYEYMDLSMQPYDFNKQPMVHELFDRFTGQKKQYADIICHKVFRDDAKALAAANYQIGEVVQLDISIRVNQYGNTEVSVLNIQSVSRQPQPQPNPTW